MVGIVKIIAVFILIVFVGSEAPKQFVEDLSVLNAFGSDIRKIGKEDEVHEVVYSSYNFEEENKVTSNVISAEARTSVQVRSERQLKSDKKLLIGLEKVDIWSEEFARKGIVENVNSIFINPSINDTRLIAVCKGDPRYILKYSIPGYPSSADYIEGMIKNAKEYNFFTDNYKAIDVYVRMDSEGRNVTLPYIELSSESEGLKITGLALFNKDKMVGMLPIQNAKILNLLSNGSGKGIISIQESSNKFLDYYAKAKRKVSCTKEDDKYKFFINIRLKGDIVANEYNKNLRSDVNEKKLLEKKMALKIEEMCNDTLKIMQNQYKVDFLELGRVAAAKYGRDKGTDWNNVVSNSEIKVNVKVKIDKQGRGDY